VLRARAVRLLSFLVVLVLLAGSGACRGPALPYRNLTPHASPLREQFNADAGKTRILLLPAPT
jgi:hypothetical protein